LRRRYLALATGAALTWAVLAIAVVPRIIRSAYLGESLPVLNGLITGQSELGVEAYLAAWRGLALMLTALLAVLAVAVAALIRHPRAVPALATSLRRRLPELRDRDVLLLAAAFGLIAGGAEAVRRIVWYRALRRVAGEIVSGELFWMAPVAAMTVLLVIGLSLICVRRLVPRLGWLAGLAPFGFAALCVYSFGRAMAFGLHPLGLVALSVGVGTAVTGAVFRNTDSVSRWMHRGVPIGVVAVVVWALALPSVRRLAEAWDLRGALTPVGGSPNVILIVWDTVRSRSLSLYGYERGTTPYLEELADSSVVFDRAVAAAPWTLPSHASLFTGVYHHQHSAGHTSALDGTHRTLAEALAAQGYQTGGFVANEFWGGTGFGLQRGFQWYEYWKSVTVPVVLSSWWISGQLGWRIGDRLGAWPALRIDAADINESFLAWVDRRDESRPFFAFLNLFDAHDPYIPPDGFGFHFSDGERMHEWKADPGASYTESELSQLRDAYESCIYYLDVQLRELVGQLKERGLLDNTLIVLTADHGETIGEHGADLVGHENNIYHDVLNVPLLFYYPRRFSGGTRSRVTVSLVDVAATVMEVVGSSGPESSLPGHSLVPLLTGSAEPAGRDFSPALSQTNPTDWHRDYPNWPVARGPLYSLVEGSQQYILNEEGEEQLFDIEADSWETTDLVSTQAGEEAARRLQAALRRLLSSGTAGSGG